MIVVLLVIFIDGDQSIDLSTISVEPSLGVQKLQAIVVDCVSVASHQISALLAHPRARAVCPSSLGACAAAVAVAFA